ncbi:MAG: MotA/TolQ/ExbB proton channel family protein [Methyloligellaceae bacterium]
MFEILNEVPQIERMTKLVSDGGAVVAILLILGVFTGTIMIRKLFQFIWLMFAGKARVNFAIGLWISGDRENAYKRVERLGGPTAKVVAHLMRGMMRGAEKEARVREDVERIAAHQLSKLRSWFRAIEAVVQVAPLLGLFGTVIGMIEAFQNLQNAGTEVDPALLAGGIWVALLTTAVGLAVAIPAAFVLYWLESMADKEQEQMEAAITSILTGRITEGPLPQMNKVVSVDHAA